MAANEDQMLALCKFIYYITGSENGINDLIIGQNNNLNNPS